MSTPFTGPKYVQVNVGEGSLTPPQFQELQSAVDQAIRCCIRGRQPRLEIFRHSGFGRWEGNRELSVYLDVYADVDTYALRVRLRRIALDYNTTIALIVGSDLITAD